MTGAVLEFSGTSKAYGGLRPLRIAALRVAAGDRVAILGLDQPSAEVFVNLATGATLPDAGDVSVFGRPTRTIDDSADWLATVDRFGIVSERAEALAREVGLPEASWTRPVADLDPAGWLRVRFGRAIALDPAILLLEHASARLRREEVGPIGAQMRAVAAGRGIALVAATADEPFARAVADRVLTLEPATGRLKEPRRWFGR